MLEWGIVDSVPAFELEWQLAGMLISFARQGVARVPPFPALPEVWQTQPLAEAGVLFLQQPDWLLAELLRPRFESVRRRTVIHW
jgi:hypothetical protein